ncbi:MAG: prepilin-type N-terminal cleavage/methylation domain-containing protein [Rhodocyclaceae bacterium]|nr:MAG: prepilin-type N-terminal cleavage/methylation domain-containing protein [Rhodocyclaceae bacterium]
MKNQQSGFTLVEIAIVLVIIGLLLGGVLKGQELINSAKVKSLASEFRAIPTFIYGYQDRFRSLPGDDRDATRVGGTNATNGTRGNGVIEGAWDSEDEGDESFLFWQHVRLANLAVGPTSFSGTAADKAAFIPRNAEGGRIGVTGRITISSAAWNATFFACSGQITGRFAKQLDTTMDDGKADTGTVRVFSAVASDGAGTVVAAPADSGVYVVCVGY